MTLKKTDINITRVTFKWLIIFSNCLFVDTSFLLILLWFIIIFICFKIISFVLFVICCILLLFIEFCNKNATESVGSQTDLHNALKWPRAAKECLPLSEKDTVYVRRSFEVSGSNAQFYEIHELIGLLLYKGVLIFFIILQTGVG